MRDGRPCLRFVRFYIVGILLLLHNPRAGKAMVPEFQSSLAVGDVTPDVDPRHEVRRPQERNLRERIIADAVANAFADVIREKGGDTKSLPTTGKKKTAAVKQPKVTPSGTPVNTKEFAYTNIRFKSFVNDDASDKKDDNFIQSLQETAVQHEAVQQQHEEETKKLVDVSSSQDDTKDLEAQLNAKLAAIQKEMSDLEDLKKAIEASKKEGDKTSGGDAKRRLLFSMPGVQPKAKFKKTFSDIGTPGWDAFRLLNKKGDFFQDNMNQFQKHIGDKSARLNNQLIDLLSLGTDKVADIVKYQGDKQVLRSDNARDILDAVKEGNLEKIGRLQDVLLSAMERVQDKKDKLLDKIY